MTEAGVRCHERGDLMARPRGEVRQVLAQTLARLVVERGALSAKQVAEASHVGYDKARRTLHDMVDAGAVVVVGLNKAAGANCWHNLYELADPGAMAATTAPGQDVPQAWGGIEVLAEVMQHWPSQLDD